MNCFPKQLPYSTLSKAVRESLDFSNILINICLAEFLSLFFLLGVKWFLIMVFTCISMMTSIFSWIYYSFAYLPWRNVYSDHLSIFKLVYLSFYYWVLGVLHILDIRYLTRYIICKYFLSVFLLSLQSFFFF